MATTFLFRRAIESLRLEVPDAFIYPGPHLSLDLGPERNGAFDIREFDPSELVCTNGQGVPFEFCSGVDAEVQWADIVAFRISEKLKKLRKRYSQTVPVCDLLLYSSPYRSIRDLREGVARLRKKMEKLPAGESASVVFRRVSIVCEHWAIFDALGTDCKIMSKEG